MSLPPFADCDFFGAKKHELTVDNGKVVPGEDVMKKLGMVEGEEGSLECGRIYRHEDSGYN